MDLLHLISKEKRRSLINRQSSQVSKNNPKHQPKASQTDVVGIDIELESPPLIFYGSQNSSTGALLSGQVTLSITRLVAEVKSLEMTLVGKATANKPVAKSCPNCQAVITVIQHWIFIREPQLARLQPGKHSFPFSYHLQGHLPTTSHGSLGSIEYALEVRASPSFSPDVHVSRPITIGRALNPTSDQTHVRKFTPLEISGKLTLPYLIHPIGLFPVQLQLLGVCGKLGLTDTRHHILKLSWRIEEHSSNISPACPAHKYKVGGDGKGIFHKDMSVIGSKEIKTGFKNDFDTPGGQIEVQFQACVNPEGKHVCDVKSPMGFTVFHLLVVELILCERQALSNERVYTTLTGSATLVKMQAKVILTERAGLGIAWDEEQPPVYDDVPSSPPAYTSFSVLQGEIPPEESI
jgi:arrestin-related trafficking adapter 1